MGSSNRGSLCKALLFGRTCAGFRVSSQSARGRCTMGLRESRITLSSCVNPGVVHLEAQFLDVAITERVAQVSRDAPQDQRRSEVPALEIVLGSALQPLDKGVQDHPPPPVREAPMRPAYSTSRKRQKLCDRAAVKTASKEVAPQDIQGLGGWDSSIPVLRSYFHINSLKTFTAFIDFGSNSTKLL